MLFEYYLHFISVRVINPSGDEGINLKKLRDGEINEFWWNYAEFSIITVSIKTQIISLDKGLKEACTISVVEKNSACKW